MVNQKVFIMEITIFLLSFIIRINKLIFDPVLMRDSTLYLNLVTKWSISNNIEDVSNVTPVFPLLPLWIIKQFMLFIYHAEYAGRSLSIFLGSSIPVIGFVLARKATNSIRVAIVTAFLLMIHPVLLAFSVQTMRENYYLVTIMLMIMSIIDAIKKRDSIKWCCAGALCAISCFCRYEAFEFLVLFPVIVLGFYLAKRVPKKEIGKSFLLFYSFYMILFAFLAFVLIRDYSFVNKIGLYYELARAK